MVAERVLERLDTPIPFEGKRYPIRAIIQMQARHMATFLRGEREIYQLLHCHGKGNYECRKSAERDPCV